MDMPSEEYRPDGDVKSSSQPWYRGRRFAFAVLVLLPSLLVLAYTAFIASPEFESRGEFIVRGMERDAPPIGGIAELVGADTGLGSTQREALAIRDFLLSLEAIEALDQQGVDVEAMLYGPEADWFSTLYHSDRRAEGLRDYYRAMVDVDYDSNDGITRLNVRAYVPEDAQQLASALIDLGEERVNTFNTRAIAAGEKLARAELDEAEQELAGIQAELTNFRDLTGELDPATKGEASQKELEAMEAELILERANLASMRQHLSKDSPLVVAASGRVSALASATGSLRARLAGDADALAGRLSSFEQLKLRQEFAAKRYEAARARLEEAQSQAAQQRLFLVPVVTPNLPEKLVAPSPIRTTLSVFLGLALAFAIGWLLLAGIREHQAD